jgi:hypothetical protein
MPRSDQSMKRSRWSRVRLPPRQRQTTVRVQWLVSSRARARFMNRHSATISGSDRDRCYLCGWPRRDGSVGARRSRRNARGGADPVERPIRPLGVRGVAETAGPARINFLGRARPASVKTPASGGAPYRARFARLLASSASHLPRAESRHPSVANETPELDDEQQS